MMTTKGSVLTVRICGLLTFLEPRNHAPPLRIVGKVLRRAGDEPDLGSKYNRASSQRTSLQIAASGPHQPSAHRCPDLDHCRGCVAPSLRERNPSLAGTSLPYFARAPCPHSRSRIPWASHRDKVRRSIERLAERRIISLPPTGDVRLWRDHHANLEGNRHNMVRQSIERWVNRGSYSGAVTCGRQDRHTT